MAKAVGLDLGTRSIKIVELEGNPKKYKITRFASCELPAGADGQDPETVLETLGELIRSRKVGRDTVVSALPANGITIREINVPFKTDEQIRKVVKFEAETHLHATAIEDVVVDFVPIGETKDGTRLVVFAAPKETIREQLDLLKRVDIDPRAIDLDVIALFNAVTTAGLTGAERNVVVADIGASSTKLLLVQNGEIRAVRSLRMGTDSITRRLETDLEVEFDEAEDRQALPSGPPPDDLMVPVSEIETREVPETAKTADRLENDLVLDRRRGFLEKVSRELTRSMGAFAASGRIDSFYVTGGGSRAPEVVQELSERFGVPVEPLDLLENIPHHLVEGEPEDLAAHGAVAIGLALKQLGAETVAVDFRQEEFGFARKFEIIKLALAVGVSFVFILVFLYFLSLQRQVTTQDYQYRLSYEVFARGQLDKVVKRYERIIGEEEAKRHRPRFKGELTRVKAYYDAMNGILDELVNQLGVNPDIPPIRSCLEVLREFVDRIRGVRENDIEWLKLDQIKINQKGMSLRGTISGLKEIGILSKRFGLGADDLFQKFDSRNSNPTKDGHVNLDIEIVLSPPDTEVKK